LSESAHFLQAAYSVLIAGFGGNPGELRAKLVTMNIVLGITGGIAAYKTPDLVRRLRARGADVQIVMTTSAEEFVTETALQAVSGRPIRSNLWDKEAEASMSHIELARWADVVLIAPATAEIMARLASGAAADLLTTLCLATEAPIAIAPAMNHVMWEKAAVQDNRKTLEDRGFRILGPDHGSQACGETGAGRMLEPDDIAAIVCGPELGGGVDKGLLAGKTVLVTAGPTRGPIDPVRYITNRSSGKMGYAIASAAAAHGAKVILVSGPVSLPEPAHVEVFHVKTAEQMYIATHEHIPGVDIFIAAAAVSDYRPLAAEEQKIKKNQETMTLELVRSRDILASVAALENAPFTVGFAAETNDVRKYALGKLENKRLDMIVANRVGDECGFDSDDNTVDVYWRDGDTSFPTAAKTELAHQIVELLAERYDAGNKKQPRKGLHAVH
jgi:phosphopantothenoylcysteine decarboxylase/phosphopantothenate--cysteine ligase